MSCSWSVQLVVMLFWSTRAVFAIRGTPDCWRWNVTWQVNKEPWEHTIFLHPGDFACGVCPLVEAAAHFILMFSVYDFISSDLCWRTWEKFGCKGQQGCSYENSCVRGPVYPRQRTVSAEPDSRRHSLQNKGPYCASKNSTITSVVL